ncbi:MAG: hypothetical protein ABIT83_04230 [Massilia sp.]
MSPWPLAWVLVWSLLVELEVCAWALTLAHNAAAMETLNNDFNSLFTNMVIS